MDAIIFILLLAAGYGVVSYWKNLSQQQLDSLISECSPQKIGVKCHIIQAEKLVPAQYRLQQSEQKYLNDIANEFQRQLDSASYIKKIVLPKTKYEIQPIDFVTAELYYFLLDHWTDKIFAGNKMFEKEISRDSTSITYQLTDFGIAYHKVFYICANYTASSKPYSPNSSSLKNASDFTDVIDAQTVCVPWRTYDDQDFIYRHYHN